MLKVSKSPDDSIFASFKGHIWFNQFLAICQKQKMSTNNMMEQIAGGSFPFQKIDIIPAFFPKIILVGELQI